MKVKLLPCPHCGSDDLHSDTEIFKGRHFGFVECLDCPALMRTGTTEEEAVKAWNKRSLSKNMKERVLRKMVSSLKDQKNIPSDFAEILQKKFWDLV